MSSLDTPGHRFRDALKLERPLQVAGTVNAYCALLAEHAGFRAIYLSGAGVANASFGLPDLGITTLPDVAEDVRRVTGATPVPLLVDIDTGWGSVFTIARAIRHLTSAGAAGVHIEDQVQSKRCGHRPNKAVVPVDEMVDRLSAATDARSDDQFVLIARTDALACEGLDAALERVHAYVDAGADMIFPEAVSTRDQYLRFVEVAGVPVLANITEFGVTPLFNVQELAAAGVALVLYPLTAFRLMSAAALTAYTTLRATGTQQALVPQMQTRQELYDHLGYDNYERRLDALLRRDVLRGAQESD